MIFIGYKIGGIINSLTKAVSTLGYNFKNIPYNISDESIKTFNLIMIDNDLYEEDHEWFEKEIYYFLNKVDEYKIPCIIFKNTDKQILKLFKKFETNKFIIERKYTISTYIINTEIFNPSFSKNNKDILIFSFHNGINENLEHIIMRFDATINNFDKMTSKNQKELFEQIKNHKILYIPYSKELDTEILQLIIKLATLLNTKVIIDDKFNISSKYNISCSSRVIDVYFNFFLENPVQTSKLLNKYQREIFIINSNIMNDITINESGIFKIEKNYPKISIIISTFRRDSLLRFITRVNKQRFVQLEVVLLTHGFILNQFEKEKLIEKCKFKIIILEASFKYSLGECLNMCIEKTKYNFITKMDDDDIYYKYYLIDNFLALNYSKSEIVGKGAHFVYLQDLNLLILRESHKSNQFDNIIMGATIFTHKKVFGELSFNKLNKSEDSNFLFRAVRKGFRIYQTSPFEYCVYRSVNLDNHTWKIETYDLLENSKIIRFCESTKNIFDID